ncbi:MAG: cyclic nucleotide-binding domain-containing protein [Deltaproteobacteria bacterium]|nr:cyclic nucleotide-binding domain-containing protein [Deltaproteobacteria bacterium]
MTTHDDKRKKLSETAVFRDMPVEMLDEISGVVEDRVVPARTVVFKRGDPGDSFWVIRSGKVRVFRSDDQGVEITLSELGPGQSFGEVALLTGEARSASVETLEETQALVLTKEQFEQVLKSHPEVSLTFIKQLSGWLKRDEQALETEARRMATPPQMSWFDFVLLIGVSILFALVFNQSNPNGIPLFQKLPSKEAIPSITLFAAAEEYKQGEAVFVDAMPANFYDKRHIKGAVNMPLALFDIVYLMTFDEESKTKKIIVYGRTISKLYDLEVANKLALRGYKNTKVLEGRLSDWEKKGYPVEP